MTPTGLLGSTANGEVDSGERGISGVIINLVDSTGAIVETTTTNRFGLYYFDVLPGQWTTQVAPENFNLGGALEPYAPTVDYTNDGNGDNQRTQTVVDADILTYDYGYVAVSGSGSNSLGDQVWVETDGNGDYNTADGDVGLGNVTIDLYFDTPADPNPGDYETFISQVTTEPDGFYDFVNLPNGDYKVVVTDENGATAGLTHILGSNPGQNNNSQEIPYYILNLDSVTQPTNFTADFGYLRAFKPAAIGNYVWVDENNDGLQDAGEVGIPNVTVQLLQNGTVVDTRQTDAQGGYLFDNLEAGTYTVQVDGATIPDGMTQTTNPVLPNADFGNQSQPYTLSVGEGEENLTADFGYNYNIDDEVNNGNGPAVIGDRVWVDVDGDGAQDPNEVGIEGVTVTLYSDPDGDGVYDTVVGTDVTDSNGNYIFDNLPAGGYVVEVDAGTLPTGYVQTGDPDEFGQPATAPDNKTTSPVILAPAMSSSMRTSATSRRMLPRAPSATSCGSMRMHRARRKCRVMLRTALRA